MFFDHLQSAGYVCAHRGARALAPENTMLAAELGLVHGADFWEMDVQRTADGELVVFHDDDLGRTTDVSARHEFCERAPWPLRLFSLEELRSLDAGTWFAESDPYGTIARGEVRPADLGRMRGQRIPSLEKVLAFTRRNDFPMNLEIKDLEYAPGDLSIVSQVLRRIREAKAEDLILVSSFNHDYLAEMHRLAPEIPLAALVEGDHPENIERHLADLGAVGYHPDEAILDEDMVRRLTGAGIHVSPYTVNDMDRALSLIEAGCFGIITDFTHTLRKRLDAR
ncbi:Glycerophosphoryl diester phosphodiesterase [Pseudodesulfovibrio hydrargyri]|uniref:Glycerophosphoryl diester phosphodiesterase n=1 Tax=Pseudodesulfovibrio hydrargyri TaxID=2125990 RepID=A0A1J5N1A8_9BACT|nr:glycerophosphodiester phosphodiesterase family protein [Pseudodesulfovibrio hydrargyri]OIQ52398.1 Glycerophosphoryl diester phosphodiesterase [Pseudodesulfovibrio hydrargyri]